MIAISAVFTAGGAVAVIRSGTLIMPTVFFGACLAIGVLSPWLSRRVDAWREQQKDRVEFDDTSVRRRTASGAVESLTWDELDAIDIVTPDAGPYVEDVFWLLMNGDRSRGCAISNGAHGFTALLPRLQRLPGFDNMAVARAMGSAANARFVVWRRSG